MNLARRLSKLEKMCGRSRGPGIIVRFEQRGYERYESPPEAEENMDEGTTVILVRFVKACDGRPVECEEAP